VRDAGNLPERVRDSLSAVLTEARDAVRAGDAETARECTETAADIIRHKVPPGQFQSHLEHGLAAVERTAADEPLVASEYLRLLTQSLEPKENS
jgi:hypothetical protein